MWLDDGETVLKETSTDSNDMYVHAAKLANKLTRPIPLQPRNS